MNISKIWLRVEGLLVGLISSIGKRPMLFLLLLCLANIYLKAYNLYDASMWLDEVSQVNLSLKSLRGIVEESLIYPNAPFYTILLSFWMNIFGIGEVATRFLSVIFSVATVPVLFYLGRRHFNNFTAVFSVLLFTVSHLHLYYSHEVRSYTLVSLLAVVSFFLFLDILERNSWKKTAWLILVNTLLLYTHLTTILIFPAQGLIMFFYLKDKRKLLQVSLSFVIPVLLLSIWFFNNSWFGGNETTWLPVPKFKHFGEMFMRLLNNNIGAMLGGLIVALSVGFYLVMRSRQKVQSDYWRKVLFLALWAIVPVLLLFLSSIFYNPRFIPRYILYASIGLYLLVAYISSLKSFPNLIKWVLFAALLIHSGLKLNLNPYKGESWNVAANYYHQVNTSNSVTIVSAWYMWMPFAYYYNKDHFKDCENTLNILEDENVHFANGKGILKRLNLDEFDQIILVLSHYRVVDPNQTLLKAIEEKYQKAEEYKRFKGIEVYVFKPIQRND